MAPLLVFLRVSYRHHPFQFVHGLLKMFGAPVKVFRVIVCLTNQDDQGALFEGHDRSVVRLYVVHRNTPSATRAPVSAALTRMSRLNFMVSSVPSRLLVKKRLSVMRHDAV
jgi:hypothetical protein